MRGERPGVGATRHRLQHRPLELDEPVGVQHLPHGLEDRGARQEVAARGLVADQMEIAAALLQVRILQPVPLLRERPQALREHRPATHEHGELALLRHAHGAGGTDDVAEVHLVEKREELWFEILRARRRAGRRRCDPAGRGTSTCPCRASAPHGRPRFERPRVPRRAARRRRPIAPPPPASAPRPPGPSPTSARTAGTPAASSRSKLPWRAARTSASRDRRCSSLSSASSGALPSPVSLSSSAIGLRRVPVVHESQTLKREPGLVMGDGACSEG